MQLLQIDVLSTPEALSSAPAITVLHLLLQGGWVIVPLLLFSVLTVYALLERLLALRKAAPPPQRWLDNIYAKLRIGDFKGVEMLCAQKPYAMAKVIQAGAVQLSSAPEGLAMAVENAAQTEVYKLEKHLSLLATMASAAPMLGFLGTVLGMIQAFMAMSQTTHQISPQLLSGGIYEAMITTAAGLVVGIVAKLSYNYLLACIQKATQRLEQTAYQLVTLARNLPSNQASPAPHEAAH